MPSHYAHYYLGREVARELPEDIKSIIKTDRTCMDAYLIGLQGPDILAFYMPYLKNALNKEGRSIHNSGGKAYFARAIDAVQSDGTPQAYSYIFGSVCHYMLDSACHPMVYKYMKDLGATHAKIEREFDSYLIYKDGKNPIGLDTKNILPWNRALGDVISPFYVTTSPRKVNESIGSMIRYLKLLSSRNAKVRSSAYSILSAISIEGVSNKRDMIVSVEKDPAFDQCNGILYTRLIGTIKETISEMSNIMESIQNDAPLSDRFKLNYLGN